MHLEVAAVDAVVVGDDHPGQLDVLVGERLERTVELLGDQIEPVERLGLERCQVFMELTTRFRHARNAIRR